MSINLLMTLLGTTFLLLVASSQALKLSLGDPCTVADYPKLCRRTIKGQTNVNAATDMAIKELMKRTMQAKDMAKKEQKGDGGVAVCLSTFGSAFDNLDKALKNIQGNDGFSLNINLSAALTDYDTCSDAMKETAFDGLRLSRSAQFVVGRLLCFWDSKNIKKQGEFVGITLQLLYEKTHEADFICKGRVVEVMQQNGWSFVSCTGCSTKLDKFGTSLRCTRCINPNIIGVIKYRVELLVDDGNDNATFVVFGREMLKLTKQDAAGLTLAEMNGGGDVELPQCLKDLAGKDFVFQIRVTPFNFTPSHHVFTVSDPRQHHPQGGEPSASASVKATGEGNEPNPPACGVKESGRKRPHE
ncbi:unnamed protein product [Brassica rapa subsp. narinosa]